MLIKRVSKKEQNSNSSKQKILDAARIVFAQKGFEGATSRDIAELAGCSVGLIFKYYNDKQNLFKILVVEWFSGNMESLLQLPSSTSLAEEINLLVDWFINNFTERKDLHKIFLFQRFNVSFHNNFVSEHQEYLQQRLEIIQRRLSPYIEAKQLPPDLDINQLCEIIHGYILVEVLFRDITPEQLINKRDSFIKLIFDGIKRK